MEAAYKVQKRTLALTFYSWQESLVRTQGVERAKLFAESIGGLLALNGRQVGQLKLPANKNTWNDWKRLPPSKTIFLSKEACLAIKTLTGDDVTPDGALGEEYNSTELAIIAKKPTSRVISNSENEDEKELYEVSCERVAFRRSRTIRVEMGWSAHEKRTLPRRDSMREIGSAIIGLRRADVRLEADGEVRPIVTLLSQNESDPMARAEGVSISDDPVCAGRWIVEAQNGDILVGSLDLTRLAHAFNTSESEMHLSVEADKNDFEVDFRPLGEWPARTTADEARSNMRRYFIANILRLRLAKDDRAYLLSKAPVSHE